MNFSIFHYLSSKIIKKSSFESAVTTNEGVASMDSIYEKIKLQEKLII